MLWQRLIGLFGGEALARKFGDVPPPEWVAQIARLKDFELDRGLRRLLRSGREAVPSLPVFARLCRQVTDEDKDEPTPKRALVDPWQGDAWDVTANRHLLAHIARQALRGVHYASEADRHCGQVYRPAGWKADALTQALTGTLVAWKNAWARDCREARTPSVEDQRRWWTECLARAETQCQTIRDDPHSAALNRPGPPTRPQEP